MGIPEGGAGDIAQVAVLRQAGGMSTLDRRAFLAAAGASAAVPFTACAEAREPAGWRTMPSLPWAVQEIYCAVSNGGVVTAGGLRRVGGVTGGGSAVVGGGGRLSSWAWVVGGMILILIASSCR